MSRYFTVSHLKQLYEVTQWSASVIKVGVVVVDICILSHLKGKLTWAIDKWLWVISTIT